MRLTIFSLLILTLTACSEHRHDPRLTKAYELASNFDTAPAAIDSIKAIDRSGLSEPDRHFHDFLSIKAADKAYERHKTDSLILDVIDYYSKNGDGSIYPEALYYGGRVYSDLGDYPTALKYFHDALDLTLMDENMELRGHILSQTARLFNTLHIYDEAIKYLKDVIVIDSIEKDTFNLAYDNQLLGAVYLHQKDYVDAKLHIQKAHKFAKSVSPQDATNMKAYLAEVELFSGNTSNARQLIQNLIDSVTPDFRNFVLINASEIYLKSGILDTAYKYAFDLVHNVDNNNREGGYKILFSPELLPLSHQDSIIKYVSDYHKITKDFYDKNESQLALIQTAAYNYQKHERERLKAEEKSRNIAIWCLVSVIIAISTIAIALYIKFRSKQTIIELNDKIDKLKSFQETSENKSGVNISSCRLSTNAEELRQQLNNLLKDIEQRGDNTEIPSSLTVSIPFKKIQEYILKNKQIPDSNEIWESLYETIEECSPDFWNKINQLFGTLAKPHERQTIALIKCGVIPSQMATLLGKTKGTISSRRESLCLKIFGEKTTQRVLDAAIRLL